MRRVAYLTGGSLLAMSLAIGFGGAAAAQQPPEVEAVIVTGSLIRGTPENAALPVDVISSDELSKQGAPTTVELLKGLSVSSGVLGDTNQFDSRAQGSEGSGSVNLRGLGPTRTLVLLNGKRMPVNPFALAGAGAVDTNILPVAAIGRVEVLKDGAAATYGSDAIGGVVNFITRSDFKGLEIGASYKYIDGSDGDYTVNLITGGEFGNSRLMFAAGYQHRSVLKVTDRDWAQQPYLANPEGGWSAAGNPSSFVPLPLGSAAIVRDNQCAPIGGYPGFSGTTPVCYWHYTDYDNIVEKEDRYQLFGQWDIDLTDKTKFHLEGLYSETDVPDWRTSPSYALLSTPTAVTSPVPGQYYVPSTNPGYQAYRAANPGAGLGPVGALVVASRPFGMGGNPLFDYGASQGSRNFKAFRLSANLSGAWTENIGWDVSATYGEERGVRTGYDTVVSRYQLALRGLGGANCNGIVAGNAGSTCEWFNPFSSAIPANAITGAANGTYNPALANSAELTRWFFQELKTEQKTSALAVDAVINGKAWALGGGDVGWAVGVQYRKQTFQAVYNDISNRALNPCVDTPVNGDRSCANPNGPFAFLGVGSNADVEQDLYSVFGEVVLPFTDTFNATLAARYEDYGGATGSTFDPKLSLRWQVFDNFALRGSVGTTFRAPSPAQINDDYVTSLQGILGVFRAVDIYGNPNLQPETALTYSVGAIIDVGGFNATIDYWGFDFKDPITTDPVAGIVNAVFPNGAAGANNCANPAFASLVSRFTFTGGVCAAGNIQRLKTLTVNGANVKTSGVDVLADYKFDALGGKIGIGGGFTYVIEYKTSDTQVAGLTVAPGFDAVGLLNYQTTAYPLPQWKGNLYLEYSNGPHNLRWTFRYIGGYDDQRLAPFAAGAYKDSTGAAQPANTNGKSIDAFITNDVTYRVFLPAEITMAVSVDNVFDEDPPFARLDLNYDPFTASGLGRTVKLSINKKF